MKAVILAGGFGTRISEESAVRPKPMVNIGSEPILWHILKIYAAHGINDFVIQVTNIFSTHTSTFVVHLASPMEIQCSMLALPALLLNCGNLHQGTIRHALQLCHMKVSPSISPLRDNNRKISTALANSKVCTANLLAF